MNKQNPEEVVVSQELEREEESALREYWTQERMDAAEPLPFSIPAGSIDDAHVSTPELGEPMSGESRAPEGETFLPHPEFSTSLVKDMTVFPYQCVGKLFFVHQGTNHVCSAYVIGESTIGTAGHCVYKQGNWATKMLFSARHNNGSYIGQWGLKYIVIPESWEETENYVYDMALGIARRPIRPTTGKLGWMANYPADQGPYTQIGYPKQPIPDYPFDGKRMWKTVGNYISHTGAYRRPRIIKASGNMTGGCSGGPWAVFKEGGWKVNGVNSHRYDNDPYHIYSPYFGNAFVSLMRWMRENGGDTPAAV